MLVLSNCRSTFSKKLHSFYGYFLAKNDFFFQSFSVLSMKIDEIFIITVYFFYGFGPYGNPILQTVSYSEHLQKIVPLITVQL